MIIFFMYEPDAKLFVDKLAVVSSMRAKVDSSTETPSYKYEVTVLKTDQSYAFAVGFAEAINYREIRDRPVFIRGYHG